MNLISIPVDLALPFNGDSIQVQHPLVGSNTDDQLLEVEYFSECLVILPFDLLHPLLELEDLCGIITIEFFDEPPLLLYFLSEFLLGEGDRSREHLLKLAKLLGEC